jgi:FkbM family methyltransferase
MIKELMYGSLKEYQIPTGYTALDIGANKGEWSRELSTRFKYVYAYDPILQETRYQAENIYWFDIALWHENNPKLPFQEDCDNHEWSTAIDEPLTGNIYTWDHRWKFTTVKAFTLDGFCWLPDDHVDFIKIDVEGAEVNVVKGGLDVICNQAQEVFIEIHKKEHFEEIDSLIGSSFRSYTLYRYSKVHLRDEWENFFWVSYRK